MSKRWTSSNTAVYNLGYHLIWCPKYRRPVLRPPVDERLKEVLGMVAENHGWTIEKMEVMEDHVHVFLKLPPTVNVTFAVNQLKGASSRILREEFPHLKKRIPSLWTRSYYAESIGHLSEDTIKRYIEDQKKV